MDSKGYYKTLGVAENASQEDIKKAFHKLSLRWHPDRWVSGTDEEKKKAEEEFKKIAEAYNVLGDEQKRRSYDAGGNDNDGWERYGESDFKPFADMFRRAGFGFNFGGQQQPSGHKGFDFGATITITLKEAIDGTKKEITIKRNVECPDCHGTGSEDGQEHKCQYCNGTGTETHTERRGNTIIMTNAPCSHCNGTGKQIDHPCKKCNGTGSVGKEEKMTIDVPAGVRNGMTIIYSGLGDKGTPGYPDGDLHLTVWISQDQPNYFKMEEGNNIYHDEYVEFVDAILGGKVTVKCPDGSDWTIKLHECTQPGEKYTKTDGGYKNSLSQAGWNVRAKAGDYIVRINYKVPGKLTKKQKKALEDYKSEK